MERKTTIRTAQNNPHAGIKQGFIAMPADEELNEPPENHSEEIYSYQAKNLKKPYIAKVNN